MPPGKVKDLEGTHFRKKKPGQFLRPGILYWTLVAKGLSHRVTISQFQGSLYLIHSDQRGPFPISSPREEVPSQQLQSEFSEGWPQRDILKPSSFPNRYGPYGTPQTETLLSMVIFSTGVWATGIFFFRQTLKLLLSYHGWMFEMHSKTSHATKIWAVSRGTGRAQASVLKSWGISLGALSRKGEEDLITGTWHLGLSQRSWDGYEGLSCFLVCVRSS